MSETILPSKVQSREYYTERINKVIDYIEDNLDSELNLNRIAEVANFSAFHFHRIFSSITGETLNAHVRRKRLEKAARYLLMGNLPISDIYVQCGFNSSAAFARAFKEHFSMNASVFRDGGYKKHMKKVGYEDDDSKLYFQRMNPLAEELLDKKREINTKIEIREYNPFWVAYCRHVGKFEEIATAYDKLFRWAGPRGLVNHPDTKVLTLYHDDPNLTIMENLYQSACISIDESIKTEGEIGKMLIPGGKYACGYFEIDAGHFTEAWAAMYAGWLPESGYECDDRLPFELYKQADEDSKKGVFKFDICVPVKVMGKE